VRFIVFSDLQANCHKPFSKIIEGGINSRLRDATNVIDQIRDTCVLQQIRVVFFLGDLFHTRKTVDVSVLHEVYLALERLSSVSRIFLILGNHDMWSLRDGPNSIRQFEKIATIVEKPTTLVIDGQDVVLIPYIDDPQELKNAVKSLDGDIAFLHAGITEATIGPYDRQIKGQISLKLLDKYKLAFVGHYHKRQRMGNVVIPGSALQVDLGERNDPPKGFLIVEGDVHESITFSDSWHATVH
jgi:DNA repair exonuclease SbcCD nuclease subunit